MPPPADTDTTFVSFDTDQRYWPLRRAVQWIALKGRDGPLDEAAFDLALAELLPALDQDIEVEGIVGRPVDLFWRADNGKFERVDLSFALATTDVEVAMERGGHWLSWEVPGDEEDGDILAPMSAWPVQWTNLRVQSKLVMGRWPFASGKLRRSAGLAEVGLPPQHRSSFSEPARAVLAFVDAKFGGHWPEMSDTQLARRVSEWLNEGETGLLFHIKSVSRPSVTRLRSRLFGPLRPPDPN